MDKTENFKENKMGVMPVNRLLITMALPMVISMLVQAMYNIVDSIFVSQIDENALAALSVAFPVQNFMIALGSGTGVGVNALLSRSLGEKNGDEVNRAANNGVFLAFLGFIFFLIFGLFFTGSFFSMQGYSGSIAEYGETYLSICSIFSFGMFGQMMFERLLQSTGKTIYTMFTQGMGAVINIILDPILIFGLFGFPKMGVAGAAAATVLGQIFAFCLAIFFNLKKNKEIKFKLIGFRPSGRTIKRIYSVGVPSILMMSITSITILLLNQILNSFSANNSTAVAVLGVYFKLQSFIFMPVFGLNNGMVPIISYSYGARKKERLEKTIKLSILYAVCLMAIGFIVFQTCSHELLGMFDASEEMFNIGQEALKIISISFIPAAVAIISLSVFQALGNGFLSLAVSAIRQLIVLIPAAYLLSFLGEVYYVWFAFPISEIASFTVSLLFMRYVYKKEIKPLGQVKEQER